MKRFIFFIGICFALNSCEEVIDIELPQSEPRLVVEASLNKEFNSASCLNCWVRLTLTTPFLAEGVTPVTDAVVRIIDLTNNRTYDFSDINSDGFYLSDIPILPEENINYKLQIEYKGELYESTVEQIIPGTEIDSLELGDGTLFEGNEQEVVISFTDDPSIENYYLFDLDRGQYITSRDEFYQGNSFSFSYFYEEDVKNEDINITIISISEAQYNYLNVLLAQAEDSGNPFAAVPANAKGNILNVTNPENQPLGYFSVVEFDSASITIN